MSIHDLSIELLQLILVQCHPEDLASVQRTCRSIYLIAQPILYSDINYSQRYRSPRLPNLQLLSLTLLHKPSLRHQIRHLRLRGPEFWPPISLSTSTSTSAAESVPPSRFTSDTISSLANHGVKTAYGTHSNWITALRTNSREAFLVILLSLLPSLTVLAFEDDPNVHFNIHRSPLGSWIPRLPHSQSKPLSLFAHSISKMVALRTVELGVQNEGTVLNHHACILRTIASLPVLEKLTCALRQAPVSFMFSEEDEELPNAVGSIASVTSNLKNLSLPSCALSEPETMMIINRHAKLTSLNISFLRKVISPVEQMAGLIPPDTHTWLDCTLLGQLLTTTSEGTTTTNFESLTHLTLSLSFSSYAVSSFHSTSPPQTIATAGGAYECGRSHSNSDPICSHGIKGSIGSSLRSLSSLKTLSVPIPMLLGWYPDLAVPLSGVLPSSLEELYLSSEMSDWNLSKWNACSVREMVETYAQTRDTKTLRKISYELTRPVSDDSRCIFDKVTTICGNMGIKFEVVEICRTKRLH